VIKTIHRTQPGVLAALGHLTRAQRDHPQLNRSHLQLMIYKFKSKSSGDVIMLQPNGQRVLEIIGKDRDSATGIILPEQMTAAISALQSAIAAEEAAQQAAIQEAKARGEAPPRFEAISLRQRATPFIEMLRRSQRADTEVVWGV
jgi:Domain of unknown function (DUF1840)